MPRPTDPRPPDPRPADKPDNELEPRADASTPAAAVGDTEGFLSRWSRRKRAARLGEPGVVEPAVVEPEHDSVEGDTDPTVVDVEETGEVTGSVPAGVAPDMPEDVDQDAESEPVVLPALDTLDAESDYSPFMSADVAPDLRRQALRKLFSSPKFNVTDGLDDYCGDYTTFTPLGDLVPAEWRRRLLAAAERATRPDAESESGSPGPGADTQARAAIPAADDPFPAPGETPGETPAETPGDALGSALADAPGDGPRGVRADEQPGARGRTRGATKGDEPVA